MLSPLDLQNKKVVTKKRKYDKLEMDEYLDLVFENYKELFNQNQELQKQIKTLSDGVQYYRSIESTMQKALVLAEKTSKETKDAAILKAEAIEKDANAKASKIISEANQEYEAIKEKCMYLLQQFNQYKMQLKQVATAQLELITSDSFDVYSPELEAIRNANYSLPETKGAKEAETKDVVEKTMSVPEDTTEVEILAENKASAEETVEITPEKEPQNLDKTVILPDLKEKKKEKEQKKSDSHSAAMSDEEAISILTADTIDLREAINKDQSYDEIHFPQESPVKEAVDAKVVEPIEAKPLTPSDIQLKEITPSEKEPEPLDTVLTKENDAPTLDSLLQNMNLGKKKKKKGQEEDPFEFLGSVDDF